MVVHGVAIGFGSDRRGVNARAEHQRAVGPGMFELERMIQHAAHVAVGILARLQRVSAVAVFAGPPRPVKECFEFVAVGFQVLPESLATI